MAGIEPTLPIETVVINDQQLFDVIAKWDSLSADAKTKIRCLLTQVIDDGRRCSRSAILFSATSLSIGMMPSHATQENICMKIRGHSTFVFF